MLSQFPARCDVPAGSEVGHAGISVYFCTRASWGVAHYIVEEEHCHWRRLEVAGNSFKALTLQSRWQDTRVVSTGTFYVSTSSFEPHLPPSTALSHFLLSQDSREIEGKVTGSLNNRAAAYVIQWDAVLN